MERTIQRRLFRTKKRFGFFPSIFKSLPFFMVGLLSFLPIITAHANSHLQAIKELKVASTASDTAGSSAKAPLCQILFQKSNSALTSYPNEANEAWTINSIGSVARQMQFPLRGQSDLFWITNQKSDIFSQPTPALKSRLQEIVSDHHHKDNTQSTHVVELVHTLMGADQISDFFHQILQSQNAFNHESRGVFSVHERSKQSIKSSAVIFFMSFLFAPKAAAIALMPSQYLYYLHQEKTQLERTFQAMNAIQILLNHPYQNAVGIISLDQYTLSRPNIIKQDFLAHDLQLMTSPGNMGVLQENISMNIPAMRMFIDLLSKTQKNEKLGHHQKLMFDFIFESSEQDEPMLHIVIRTEKPHLYFEK